ncbi:MAG: hypothetical protein QT05_C0001G0024 [archaeon GW2011_AR13]|nr:MAG: hypothetical protein QT05_C0001G0024 [archaeon GW2011_AR13]
MNNKKFKKWLKEYDYFYKRESRDYWKRTGTNVVIPEGFDKEFLSQFIAYKNEMMTKQLVWATWALAIVSIILTVVSLFIL